MSDNQERIQKLLEKLDSLLKRQELFQKEIEELRLEINRLQPATAADTQREKPQPAAEPISRSISTVPTGRKEVASRFPKIPRGKSELEKFIGENLINKIGIAITVIGVGIGAKYAIDHQLISPLTRIILGYLIGASLLGFAIRLREKYENFSAVLLSGSMAIMYFITYAAYDFYNLIPQLIAFILMTLFTAFTVIAALNYNRQVIAHIGLVGAYAVPFLLSEGSGKVAILFSYMAIINLGILVIAFKKYWKPLYYSSFILTWLIYFSWYIYKYEFYRHFTLSFIFLSIFFVIFYLTFLSYKLIRREKFDIQDILLILSNSFIFYGNGYSLLNQDPIGQQLLGLFTLVNALVHFAVSMVIYRKKLGDRNLFYFVLGLVLVFITITIPVQLDGNWVTLLWAVESVVLFWLGRAKKVPVYEMLSFPLMFLAFLSIIHDWFSFYGNYSLSQPETRITPVFNIYFLTSLLVIAAFSLINFLKNHPKFPSSLKTSGPFYQILRYAIPAILLLVIYYGIRMEITNYWDQSYSDSIIQIQPEGENTYPYNQFDYDLLRFKNIWEINYLLLFLIGLSWMNIRKIKNPQLALFNLGLNAWAVLLFLVQGLLGLSALRESYLNQILGEYYHRGIFHIIIRYLSLFFAGSLIFSCYHYTRQVFLKVNLRVAFDFLLHTSLLWIASSELIHWLDFFHSTQSYKLWLSILWGSYALLLIAIGIKKKKRYLRISAIVLFTVTLLKLFLFDIAHLGTISKTVLFLSLGILLLIISFLYQKYKRIIFEEGDTQK